MGWGLLLQRSIISKKLPKNTDTHSDRDTDTCICPVVWQQIVDRVYVILLVCVLSWSLLINQIYKYICLKLKTQQNIHRFQISVFYIYLHVGTKNKKKVNILINYSCGRLIWNNSTFFLNRKYINTIMLHFPAIHISCVVLFFPPWFPGVQAGATLTLVKEPVACKADMSLEMWENVFLVVGKLVRSCFCVFFC